MRILGINVPNEKRLDIALTSFYGIGLSQAKKILTEAKVEFNAKAENLSEVQENAIRKVVESLVIEGSLKRKIASNVKRLKDIKSYRGVRHMRKMPVRGQRTKTNSRTVRGNVRKTMSSGRRKAEKT